MWNGTYFKCKWLVGDELLSFDRSDRMRFKTKNSLILTWPLHLTWCQWKELMLWELSVPFCLISDTKATTLYCHSNVITSMYHLKGPVTRGEGRITWHVVFANVWLQSSETQGYSKLSVRIKFRLKHIEKSIAKLRNFLIGNNKAYSLIAKILF